MKGFPASDDLWEQDVWLLSRRMALLYYYMATAIIKRLGESEGKKLIEDAIWAYGEACGHRVRESVLSQGLSPEPANFSRVPDLPSKGWRSESARAAEKRGSAVTFCPLAAVWKELGAEKLGRLYCFVDQAKFHAYNPALRVVHEENVLDGDDCCIINVTKKD